MRIMIINGPNLNLLGVREPHIYGSTTLQAIKTSCEEFALFAGAELMTIFEGPIFEVHISNIHARDELHRHSKLSSTVKAVIAGLGPYGYIVAMQAALQGAGQLPAALPPALRVGPR